MAITRWDPMSEMRTLSRRLERMMEPITGGAPVFWREPVSYAGSMWPSVDIYEDKEEIICRAELPGMEIKDVEVRLEDSTLTLQGERKLFKEEKQENYQRVESTYGSFSRSFALPPTIDRERVRAEFKNGILEVHIPKRPEAKGKTIPIHS